MYTETRCLRAKNQKHQDGIVLTNRTYFRLTKHERRMTSGGTEELNACIDVMYSVYLKSDLCSSGLRSFPQYRDHQMLLILERNYSTLEVWK